MNTKQLKLLADIQTGPFGSQLHKEDYVTVGTPIVTVEHLGNRVFTEQNLPMVSDTDKERLNKYVLKKGDIVFSRVGSVHRCSYVDTAHDGWMFSGRCLRVRPNEELDTLFLYYYFCLEETKQFVRNIAVGATMPSINTKLLGEVPITYPDIDTQRKTAQVLATIDDRIENNSKINDNLHEILQSVFQSRFGLSEESARVGTLLEICAYSKDRVAVSKLGVKNYYSTENMLPSKAGSVDAASLPTTSQTTKCNIGDVLVSNIRPYFKKIVFCQSEGGCSTDVLCFTPKSPLLSSYLFCTLYADSFFNYMVAGSKGTKMPRGDKQQIMTYPVAIPTEDELRAFDEVAQPILRQIHINSDENTYLAALRDTLLPKLMSGEIDVSDIQL